MIRAHPGPGQARRRRPRPGRGGPRPDRAQGLHASSPSSCARSTGRPPRRTTPSTTASRSSATLVDFITSGPLVAAVVEGPRRHRGVAHDDGRHRPGQGRPRHDPRRPRHGDRAERRARLGLARSRPPARSRCSSPTSPSRQIVGSVTRRGRTDAAGYHGTSRRPARRPSEGFLPSWRTTCRSSAATWPSTSAPPTPWSTSAARASCSTSRRVVAINQNTGGILAVGAEAKKMIGRTPGNIVAIRPLKDGVIADFDTTERMLRYFIQKVHKRRHLAKPRIVVCVPERHHRRRAARRQGRRLRRRRPQGLHHRGADGRRDRRRAARARADRQHGRRHRRRHHRGRRDLPRRHRDQPVASASAATSSTTRSSSTSRRSTR